MERVSKLLFALSVVAVTALIPTKAYAADQIISATICGSGSILLTLPADGFSTTNTSVAVKGTTTANQPVVVKSNSTDVAWVTTAADGSFSVDAPLVLGTNAFQARTTNKCGVQYVSNVVTVTRNQVTPPPTPTPTPTPTPVPTPTPTPTPLPVVTPPATPVDQTPPTPVAPPTEKPPGSPVIERPQDGSITNDGKVPVSGIAKPFAVVEIIVNGNVVAKVVADEKGAFSAQVPLAKGANKVQARVLSASDVALVSDLLTVTYDEKKPEASTVRPINKILEGVLISASIIIVGLLAIWILWKRKKDKDEEAQPPQPPTTIPPYSA